MEDPRADHRAAAGPAQSSKSQNERRQGYGCATRSGVTCSSAFAISAKMTDARGQRNTLADKHGSTHEDRAFHYEDDAFAAMFNLAKSVSKKTEEVELAPSLQLAIEVNTTTQRRRELHKMNANARKFEAMNWALKRRLNGGAELKRLYENDRDIVSW